MIDLVESGFPPACLLSKSSVKATRKSLPTGLATTYRGAYASEHATETMRKAVFLTPSEVPGEIAQKRKKEIREALFL